VLNRVVFGVFLGSYCLIPTMLNRVVKKVNRAQSGSNPNFCMMDGYRVIVEYTLQFPDISEVMSRCLKDIGLLVCANWSTALKRFWSRSPDQQLLGIIPFNVAHTNWTPP